MFLCLKGYKPARITFLSGIIGRSTDPCIHCILDVMKLIKVVRFIPEYGALLSEWVAFSASRCLQISDHRSHALSIVIKGRDENFPEDEKAIGNI